MTSVRFYLGFGTVPHPTAIGRPGHQSGLPTEIRFLMRGGPREIATGQLRLQTECYQPPPLTINVPAQGLTARPRFHVLPAAVWSEDSYERQLVGQQRLSFEPLYIPRTTLESPGVVGTEIQLLELAQKSSMHHIKPESASGIISQALFHELENALITLIQERVSPELRGESDAHPGVELSIVSTNMCMKAYTDSPYQGPSKGQEVTRSTRQDHNPNTNLPIVTRSSSEKEPGIQRHPSSRPLVEQHYSYVEDTIYDSVGANFDTSGLSTHGALQLPPKHVSQDELQIQAKPDTSISSHRNASLPQNSDAYGSELSDFIAHLIQPQRPDSTGLDLTPAGTIPIQKNLAGASRPEYDAFARIGDLYTSTSEHSEFHHKVLQKITDISVGPPPFSSRTSFSGPECTQPNYSSAKQSTDVIPEDVVTTSVMKATTTTFTSISPMQEWEQEQRQGQEAKPIEASPAPNKGIVEEKNCTLEYGESFDTMCSIEQDHTANPDLQEISLSPMASIKHSAPPEPRNDSPDKFDMPPQSISGSSSPPDVSPAQEFHSQSSLLYSDALDMTNQPGRETLPSQSEASPSPKSLPISPGVQASPHTGVGLGNEGSSPILGRDFTDMLAAMQSTTSQACSVLNKSGSMLLPAPETKETTPISIPILAQPLVTTEEDGSDKTISDAPAVNLDDNHDNSLDLMSKSVRELLNDSLFDESDE
ncbi:hypothetical protein GMRT_11654 [Giardia muris]|uniref:Uncharacterized protein n=1 Tax=Giardia muris TaxID=5742 RepID=A0A4Z1SUH4_GIAMU|nr:hypothetical protein GMRT_11654 [Giardia muris]|eukprot:TNJ29552.1 hypothetical protein GMRT_11654 [Giardia muris]